MADTPSTPPKQKRSQFKYGTRARTHEVVTTALEPVIKPEPKLHKEPELVVKRGPNKKVVQAFGEEDEKAKNMGLYIEQGLSAREAGLLAGYAPEELDELQKVSGDYRRFVENQMIKFKQKHLKVISDKSDPRTSQWLLERTFPEEFSSKQPVEPGGKGSGHVIAAIFKTVQSMTDTPLPTEHVDITHKKEKQGHNGGQDDTGPKPSLDAGGENII